MKRINYKDITSPESDRFVGVITKARSLGYNFHKSLGESRQGIF